MKYLTPFPRRWTLLAATMLVLPLSWGCNTPSSLLASEGENSAASAQNGASKQLHLKKLDGSKVSFTMGRTGSTLLENLPADIPIFTDASVVSAASSSEGMAVVLKIANAPDKVIEFYKTQLKAQDWQVTTTVEKPQGIVLSANKGEIHNLNISIGRHAGAEKSSLVTLMFQTLEN